MPDPNADQNADQEIGRNVYLSTIPPQEAVARAIAAIGEAGRLKLIREELIPAHEALGRVTSGPIFARCSSPTFHAAAMDGIALSSAATFAAREGSPVTLRLGRDYAPVNTGHSLPTLMGVGMDAVVMIEHVEQVDDTSVRIEAPAFPWQHVRRIGEDIVATELLLPQNHTLSAYDLGALLAAGIFEVPVWERVRLTFIPTGDEVLNFLDQPTPGPGQVIESNSQVFRAIASSWGAAASWTAPVPDRPEALRAAVTRALQDGAHIVVVGAGSSAGSKDYTRSTFEAFGEVLCHGISVMPGKPTLLGLTTNRLAGELRGRLLVGAPGYPVSAVVCLEDVLEPIVRWLARQESPGRRTIRARLARKTPSRPGMEEIVRLAVGRVGSGYVASPLARGAGLITSLTRAQAVTRIPAQSEGLEQDAEIEAELLVPLAGLDKVLVHIGSHDNILDLLANELMGLPRPLRLVSSHVGSMGGLAALKNGSALFAGCHLFDPETRDFNFPFLKKHAPGLDLVVLNLAIRHQGLIVAVGNPKNILGVADLTRPEVNFINRQRGAGTRILLDHHLDVAGINPEQVRGYDREEFTHMAVAVNVLTGAADCGLGIFAAAKALGLGFAPLAHERYDLVLPAAYLTDPRIQTLRAVIGTAQFQERMRALGGYETTFTGRVMEPGFGLGPGLGE